MIGRGAAYEKRRDDVVFILCSYVVAGVGVVFHFIIIYHLTRPVAQRL